MAHTAYDAMQAMQAAIKGAQTQAQGYITRGEESIDLMMEDLEKLFLSAGAEGLGKRGLVGRVGTPFGATTPGLRTLSDLIRKLMTVGTGAKTELYGKGAEMAYRGLPYQLQSYQFGIDEPKRGFMDTIGDWVGLLGTGFGMHQAGQQTGLMKEWLERAYPSTRESLET